MQAVDQFRQKTGMTKRKPLSRPVYPRLVTEFTDIKPRIPDLEKLQYGLSKSPDMHTLVSKNSYLVKAPTTHITFNDSGDKESSPPKKICIKIAKLDDGLELPVIPPVTAVALEEVDTDTLEISESPMEDQLEVKIPDLQSTPLEKSTDLSVASATSSNVANYTFNSTPDAEDDK